MPGHINQFSTEAEFARECLVPDLAPSDLIPMSYETSWVNPGEQILLKRGEILPLTPLGPQETDVFPWTPRAPADTTNIDYEDQIPRRQHRGDQVLRSRLGVRGPGAYWRYGGTENLGQAEEEPVQFVYRPSEIAYQTYPGPSLGALGDENKAWRFILGMAASAGMVGTSLIPGVNKDLATALRWVGVVGAGLTLALGVQNLAETSLK